MMRCAAFALALVLCLPAHGAEPPGRRLFIIERSVNSNIVVYDANVIEGKALNGARPVDAYWIMRELGGRREELNYIEKRRAYGFDIEKVREGSHYRMAIRSFRDRPISIVLEKNRPRAVMEINGRRGYLSRIFIASAGSAIVPLIDHVVLYGVDMVTGEPLREKINSR